MLGLYQGCATVQELPELWQGLPKMGVKEGSVGTHKEWRWDM